MELEIYHYSLCVSLTLLLFFSFRFLFGKLPDKQIFRQYRISAQWKFSGDHPINIGDYQLRLAWKALPWSFII